MFYCFEWKSTLHEIRAVGTVFHRWKMFRTPSIHETTQMYTVEMYFLDYVSQGLFCYHSVMIVLTMHVLFIYSIHERLFIVFQVCAYERTLFILVLVKYACIFWWNFAYHWIYNYCTFWKFRLSRWYPHFNRHDFTDTWHACLLVTFWNF